MGIRTVCIWIISAASGPYRDYVIRAYNQNKPFDQFVREQLAGDMLPVKTLDTLIGLGILARRHQQR